LRVPPNMSDDPTGSIIEVSAPFLIDALADGGGGWVGRARVDGHVLFLCARSESQQDAIQEARDSLAAHLQMLFTGATDLDHQQQTERYDSLVELEAAQVLRQAAGWTLRMVRFQDDQLVAFFQRDWP
jgi:hypothetical protein